MLTVAAIASCMHAYVPVDVFIVARCIASRGSCCVYPQHAAMLPILSAWSHAILMLVHVAHVLSFGVSPAAASVKQGFATPKACRHRTRAAIQTYATGTVRTLW